MHRVKLKPECLRLQLELGHNGLNALRLFFAALVIVSHSPPLSGHGDDPKLGVVSLGGVAVGGFFAISGYLIANSRMHLPMWRFALRRAARIYPGYWLCLAIIAFPLAGLVGLQRGGWSFHDAAGFVLLNSTLVFLVGSVGSTLAGAPLDSTWNGSLWTLPLEVLCYIGIGLVLAVPFARRHLRGLAVVGFTGLLGLDALAVMASGRPEGLLYLATFFGSGVLLYAWRSRVLVRGWLALASLIVFVVAFQSNVTVTLGALPGAYLCLWLGARMPERLKPIGAKNDISYGIYLYGWPVQQTLMAYGLADAGVLVFAALSLLCAVPLAWFSWLTVERPANRAAKRITQRTDVGAPRTARVPALGPPVLD